MKKTLLLLILFPFIFFARASDTLTIRQIYNYDVGDTFDYITGQNLHVGVVGPSAEQTYIRYVIIGKSPSITNDSVTYIRQQLYPITKIDTLLYSHLDSSIYWLFDTITYSQFIHVDTGHLSDGRVTNTFQNTCGLCYTPGYKYGDGLGLITFRQPETDGTNYFGEFDSILIYYSKGADSSGTTYYNAIGPRLPHFTPIPEDCAYWNYKRISPSSTDYFQIRTGTKTYLNNHTYIQLLERKYTGSDSLLGPDITVGYFRNDTLGQKVYLKYSISDPNDQLLYDFTLKMSDYSLGNYYTKLDTIIIGGITRIVWYAAQYNSPFFPPPVPNPYFYYIEGIGGYNGFVDLGYIVENYTGTSFALYPSLTSFCVCGHTLYPDTATGQCELLTGINDITYSKSSIHLYPTPTSDLLHLSYSEASQHDSRLIITDLLGRELYAAPVTQSKTTHDISRLPSGIYTWRLTSDDMIIKTGKVIKE